MFAVRTDRLAYPVMKSVRDRTLPREEATCWSRHNSELAAANTDPSPTSTNRDAPAAVARPPAEQAPGRRRFYGLKEQAVSSLSARRIDVIYCDVYLQHLRVLQRSKRPFCPLVSRS